LSLVYIYKYAPITLITETCSYLIHRGCGIEITELYIYENIFL